MRNPPQPYVYTTNFLGIGNGRNYFGSSPYLFAMLSTISLPVTGTNGLEKRSNAWCRRLKFERGFLVDKNPLLGGATVGNNSK